MIRRMSLSCALLASLLTACGSDPDITSGDGPAFAQDASAVQTPDGGVASWPDAGQPQPNEAGVVYEQPMNDGGCGAVKARTEPVKAPVDVVWVLDNSGSMSDEIANVMGNMAQFVDGIKAAGNVNVVTLTGGIYGFLQLAFSNPSYRWLLADVGSWNAFEVALNNYKGGVNYSQYLRPGAPLHVVVVTDDQSIPMTANDFVARMKQQLGRDFTFHAIAAQLPGATPKCGGAGPGTAYFSAADMTRGEKLSICGNFAEGMKKIQSNVVSSVPLPCDYVIPPPPQGEKLNPMAVQVVYTPTGGSDMEFAKASTVDKCADNVAWHFDNEAAPTKVVMCAKACEAVKAGGGISIGFGCAPSLVLN